MKIQYLSDLHYDYPPTREYLKANPIPVVGDILVVAGDYCNDTLMNRLSKQFKHSIVIKGNHDYYRSYINENNVDTQVHIIDNVKFVCSTLWTRPTMYCVDGINDFRLIKNFNIMMSNILNDMCIKFMDDELSKPFDGIKIAVTHHLPLNECVDDMFKGSPLNPSFVSHIPHVVTKADYWIFGHTHQAVDIMYENTRVVCNPLGYMRGNILENLKFNPTQCLSI